jgi:hypothetical protein
MMRFSVRVCVVALVLAAAPALAGEAFHCRNCAPGHGGMPYGNTGCGPRYCGEKHEPSCPDPSSVGEKLSSVRLQCCFRQHP